MISQGRDEIFGLVMSGHVPYIHCPDYKDKTKKYDRGDESFPYDFEQAIDSGNMLNFQSEKRKGKGGKAEKKEAFQIHVAFKIRSKKFYAQKNGPYQDSKG